jgi:uncharacterized membrane protein YphA (DoxX/SURF4 family)
MAIDRQGTGLSLLRIFLGVFFICQGLGKVRWFLDASPLLVQLTNWEHAAPAGTFSAKYLHAVIPYAGLFARLVPLGEIGSGLAMLAGFWTRLFAFVAFLMVLNFHLASGAVFTYGFLSNGFGLPVLGGTLALALGAVRLPWSMTK